VTAESKNYSTTSGELIASTNFLKEFNVQGLFKHFQLIAQRRLTDSKMFGGSVDAPRSGSDIKIIKMVVVIHMIILCIPYLLCIFVIYFFSLEFFLLDKINMCLSLKINTKPKENE